MRKYCPYCGAGLQEDLSFCSSCGKRFSGALQGVEDSLVSDISTEPANDQASPLFQSALDQKIELLENTETGPSATAKKSKHHAIPIVVGLLIIVLVSAMVIALTRAKISNNSGQNIKQLANSVLYLEIHDTSGAVTGSASGFIIEDGKTLVTNYHVIDNAYSIIAFTPDGNQCTEVTDIVVCDSTVDLAILKCKDCIVETPLTLADSDAVEQGDTIYAVGYPLGLSHTLSDGIVSSRYIDTDGVDFIQITAPISHGSSGGALFNQDGHVIGVTAVSYEDGQNINLAIAANSVRALLLSAEESIQLSDYYFKNNTYGISAMNLVAGCSLAEDEDYIVFEDQGTIFLEKKSFLIPRRIGEGRAINIYKGKVYYYSYSDNNLLSYDIATQKTTIVLSLSKERVNQYFYKENIGEILIANDKLFIRLYIHASGMKIHQYLLVYGLNDTADLLYATQHKITSFTYVDDSIYAGLDGGGILKLNMVTFDEAVFRTSCEPSICGTDSTGKIYYVDSQNPGYNLYMLDVANSGTEKTHNFVSVPDDKGFFVVICGDKVYESVFSGTNINELTWKNYILSQVGETEEFFSESLIESASTLSGLNRFYNPDGSTIDMKTGKNLGKWVFE